MCWGSPSSENIHLFMSLAGGGGRDDEAFKPGQGEHDEAPAPADRKRYLDIAIVQTIGLQIHSAVVCYERRRNGICSPTAPCVRSFFSSPTSHSKFAGSGSVDPLCQGFGSRQTRHAFFCADILGEGLLASSISEGPNRWSPLDFRAAERDAEAYIVFRGLSHSSNLD